MAGILEGYGYDHRWGLKKFFSGYLFRGPHGV